jgi:hypothetical protein
MFREPANQTHYVKPVAVPGTTLFVANDVFSGDKKGDS